jgi:hypothetical protein
MILITPSFQKVEGLTALQSSIRFLPHVIMGTAVNIATAYLISRVRVQTLAVVSALVTMIAPVLMATVEVNSNYWFAPFWALFLSPMNPDGVCSFLLFKFSMFVIGLLCIPIPWLPFLIVSLRFRFSSLSLLRLAVSYWQLFARPSPSDLNSLNLPVLFTVSNLIISDAFPHDIQSLAGGVFNVVAQFGNSVGLAVTAAIASSVTEHSGIPNHAEALMLGYRAAFWTIFASAAAVVGILVVGLRKGGTVGKKDQ